MPGNANPLPFPARFDDAAALLPPSHNNPLMTADMARSAQRNVWPVAAGVLGVFAVGCAAALQFQLAGRYTYLYLDNVAETVAALLAATCCAVAARRRTGRVRLAWVLLGASAMSWGLGQAVWDWYQIVRNVQVPFPSLADAGYLLAVPLAIGGVLALPVANERARTHVRTVLEGLMIAAALLVISWDTTLGAVYRAGADSTLAMVLSLLYPISDVAIITMILVRIGRVAHSGRAPLLLIAGGLAAAAVADSSFAYSTAAGTYGAGNVLDSGWIVGYSLIALAALYSITHPRQGDAPRVLPSQLSVLLPYPPVVAAVGVVVAEHVTSGTVSRFTFITLLVLVALVLVRQYLVMQDNTRLFTMLTARERELHHQANHDALTGLVNRSYFGESVTRALVVGSELHRRCAVLFIDLDEFKRVNDTHGHGVGDRVLKIAAERLRRSLRPTDIAARLGGDEFAVLIEHAPDPRHLAAVAGRILQSLREPIVVHNLVLSARGTIGIAVAESSSDTCDELLRRADVAMYAAKREGKDRAGMYRELVA